MAQILVVDDEPSVISAFVALLSGEGYDVSVAGSAEAALKQVDASRPDAIVTDVCLPGMSGLEFFRKLRVKHPRLPVIVMTGRGTMESAIEATQLGAHDYQLKPFEPKEMLSLIARAVATGNLTERQVEMGGDEMPSGSDALIGRSAAMQQVYKAIGRVSMTDATVLIRGESGAGKELVARAIYQHSLRASAPMLIVNCTAIPDALLESELFGYERGAFTGAVGRRIGKFEQASGGTIFLDEIGDMSPTTQAKMLRVLQEKTFERLGGQAEIRADVRIIAATNRNLEAAIAEGAFREDLFHRLNVVAIHIPPLRSRMDDVPLLVHYFLRRYAADLRIDPPDWADDALAAMLDYSWPGNVRELANCVYRLLILTRGNQIGTADVKVALERSSDGNSPSAALEASQIDDVARRFLEAHAGSSVHAEFLAAAESALLRLAMDRANGNQTHAAGLLGLPRPTLHAKLRKFGLIGD